AAGRIRGDAALAHDVVVGVHPRSRLRVVVVEVEGVGLRRLQEIDDLPVLVGPLREPLALGSLRGDSGRPSGEGDENQRLHRSLRPRTSRGASAGELFMKLTAIRPSSWESTWEGTLQVTSS